MLIPPVIQWYLQFRSKNHEADICFSNPAWKLLFFQEIHLNGKSTEEPWSFTPLNKSVSIINPVSNRKKKHTPASAHEKNRSFFPLISLQNIQALLRLEHHLGFFHKSMSTVTLTLRL